MAKYSRFDPRNKKKDRNKNRALSGEKKVHDVYTQKNRLRVRGSSGADLEEWTDVRDSDRKSIS